MQTMLMVWLVVVVVGEETVVVVMLLWRLVLPCLLVVLVSLLAVPCRSWVVLVVVVGVVILERQRLEEAVSLSFLFSGPRRWCCEWNG